MAASDGDPADFDAQVAPFRRELHAHCYRMLGSVHDADDAVQEALLGAWRGFAGFEGRSSLRSWLYQIATNACLRLIAERPRPMLAVERPSWLEPYPDDPAVDPEARVEQREQLELAFVTAIQYLPATQRAVLLLREVLGFEAAEVASLLETSVASVNSALQRARAVIETRVPAKSQRETLRELGTAAQEELVTAYVDAWARADAGALVALLTDDVRFSMPPLPSVFDGVAEVGRFFGERVFATPWRLVPMSASGQLAFACYQGPDFKLGALNVITVRGRSIVDICGFLDPVTHRRFSLPDR